MTDEITKVISSNLSIELNLKSMNNRHLWEILNTSVSKYYLEKPPTESSCHPNFEDLHQEIFESAKDWFLKNNSQLQNNPELQALSEAFQKLSGCIDVDPSPKPFISKPPNAGPGK